MTTAVSLRPTPTVPVPRIWRRDGESALVIGFAPGRRQRVTVRYSLWGPAGAPVIVALGGISADRRCDRWWPGVFGHGLDPHSFRILGIDWLDRYWPDGRVVTTTQQATALAGVLNHLDMARVEHLIGASYGAMTGLAFAARFPERIGRLLAISGADRPHPAAVARRLIQRRIIELAECSGRTDEGLMLARALALTTYRPDALLEQRFAEDDPQALLDALSGYFEHQGRQALRRFDAERYRCLSESLDRHRVDPADIRCPVDLVAVTSDTLVPPTQIRALAAGLGRRSRYHEIRSPFGHDAFLKEADTFNRLIENALTGETS